MQPISRFEKLMKGMGIIHHYQAAPEMKTEGSAILIGNATDQHVPDGVKKRLKDLGFMLSKDGSMFAYNLD